MHDLKLPFVSEGIRQTLGIDALHADVYKFTFHPDLPGSELGGQVRPDRALLPQTGIAGALDRIYVERSHSAALA
jgi:hypothetical protein